MGAEEVVEPRCDERRARSGCLLVRVGDTHILVGVASGSVNTLHVFPPGSNTEAPPAPVSDKPALPNFKDLLLRSLGK